MDEIDNSNPLIECPFCKKKMKGKSLVGHAKRVHANKEKPVSQKHGGVLIPKSDKLKRVRGGRIDYVVDESGFLVTDSGVAGNLSHKRPKLPDGKKGSNKIVKQIEPIKKTKSLEPTNIFNVIRQHKSRIPVAIKKSLRPTQESIVTCPICSIKIRYICLYDHVTRFHKGLNAKMVLAQFNRDYENSKKTREK